jgi:hypothetical protein
MRASSAASPMSVKMAEGCFFDLIFDPTDFRAH